MRYVQCSAKALIPNPNSKKSTKPDWHDNFVDGALSWLLSLDLWLPAPVLSLLYAILPYLTLKLTLKVMVFHDFAIFLHCHPWSKMD